MTSVVNWEQVMASSTNGLEQYGRRQVANYKILRQGMVSGFGEQESVRLYRRVPCRDGRGAWFYPVNHNEPGAYVYFDPANPGSQGFGGATLQFPCDDGVTYKVKGPWHGNTESMFKETGVDLRDQHRTFVVLSLARTYEGYNTVMVDVLYQDPPEGIVGPFDRWKSLVVQYPDAQYYYSESRGGSICGPIKHG